MIVQGTHSMPRLEVWGWKEPDWSLLSESAEGAVNSKRALVWKPERAKSN